MSESDVWKIIAEPSKAAKGIEELEEVMKNKFGSITKRVNLFGTNIAKRLERIQSAIASFGDGFKDVGGGIESGAQGVEKGIAGIGSSLGSLGSGIGDVGGGLSSVGGGIESVGSGIGALGTGLSGAAVGLVAVGTALPVAANGFMSMCTAIAGSINYIPQLIAFGVALVGVSILGDGLMSAGTGLLNMGNGMLAMSTSLTAAATGLTLLGAALPIVAKGFMQMLTYLTPTIEQMPGLLLFVATMVIFSLLGEGLLLAGQGLVAIAKGFLMMAEALPAVNAAMVMLIDCLANTTLNIGGVITFVLLAAAMFILASAIGKINEGLNPMVADLAKMGSVFSAGFIVGIAVFAVMMLLLSLALGKVASGMDKVTKSLQGQYNQLLKNIPLFTMLAILQNPFMGAITVAAATAAGFLVSALIPQMATGGVVSAPTVTMVGEGRYPEAVVPLGNSPQFARMKNDIANSVLQGIAAIGGLKGGSAPVELVLSIDGEKLARTIIPAIDRENRRKGFRLQVKEV